MNRIFRARSGAREALFAVRRAPEMEKFRSAFADVGQMPYITFAKLNSVGSTDLCITQKLLISPSNGNVCAF